jgi:hypothetical protein
LGIGDWAQSPIPNPQSPIPNPHILAFISKEYYYKNNFKQKIIISYLLNIQK